MMNHMRVSELQRRLDKERAPITDYQGSLSTCMHFLNNALTRLKKKRAKRVLAVHCAGVYFVAAGRAALALPADVAAERENYKGVFIEPFGKVVRSGAKGGAHTRPHGWRGIDAVTEAVRCELAPGSRSESRRPWTTQ